MANLLQKFAMMLYLVFFPLVLQRKVSSVNETKFVNKDTGIASLFLDLYTTKKLTYQSAQTFIFAWQ